MTRKSKDIGISAVWREKKFLKSPRPILISYQFNYLAERICLFLDELFPSLGHVSIPEQISVTEVGAEKRVYSINTTPVVRRERQEVESVLFKPQGHEFSHEKKKKSSIRRTTGLPTVVTCSTESKPKQIESIPQDPT